VRQRVKEYVAQGFRGLKWFFRYGPQHGREGMAKNLELVQTVREAAGPDVNIMFDAWKSWDVPYAVAMAERMEEFDVTWLEEPVQPDRITGYTAIRERSPIPIAGGEQEYTRWGAQALIEAGAVDYIQPDIFNAGGISELNKIATLASVNNIKIFPHARANVSVHLVSALSPDVAPFQEDLVKSSVTNEFFLKHPPVRKLGSMLLPELPGLGMELDPDKIETDETIGGS
jgi:L-alanine-DL-glutamate epimerase-like enolase superfamily enzyme